MNTIQYKIAHYLRDNLSFLWNLIEKSNSIVISLIYGQRINKNIKLISDLYFNKTGYQILNLSECSSNDLIKFFKSQPIEAFEYFHPHEFDELTVNKLKLDKSFLAFVLVKRNNSYNKIIGYFFLRCYLHGKAFRGRMVDIDFRGKGIGKLMNCIMNDIGFNSGFRIYETVSINNIASYRSALAASDVKILKEFKDNTLLLEILKYNN